MAVLKPLEKVWLEVWLGKRAGTNRFRAHRDRASVSRARVVNTVRSKADEHFTVFCAITGMECGLEPRTTSASPSHRRRLATRREVVYVHRVHV